MAKGRPDFSISGKVVVDEVIKVTSMPDPTPKGSQGIALRQKAGSGEGYIDPTGYEDADGDWTDEASAYDDNLGSAAQSAAGIPVPDWTGFLVLTLASTIRANKIRLQADAAYGMTGISGRKVDIDVHKDGAWEDVAEVEDYTEDEYIEYSFAEGSCDKYRIRFYLAESVIIRLEETDIYQVATGGGDIYIKSDVAAELLATVTQGAKDRTITFAKTTTEYSASIPAGITANRDIDLTDKFRIAITVMIIHHASATKGVRVWLLASPDNSAWDGQTEEEAYDYFDIPFAAGATKQKTVELDYYPLHLRIALQNYDAVRAASYYLNVQEID